MKEFTQEQFKEFLKNSDSDIADFLAELDITKIFEDDGDVSGYVLDSAFDYCDGDLIYSTDIDKYLNDHKDAFALYWSCVESIIIKDYQDFLEYKRNVAFFHYRETFTDSAFIALEKFYESL